MKLILQSLKQVQFNLVTAIMKKIPSKSTINKKNRTVSMYPESKKNGRVSKTVSCVKIISQNTQQLSVNNLTLHQTLSKSIIHNSLPRGTVPITHTNNILSSNRQVMVQPQSLRKSTQNCNAKGSTETIYAKENRNQLTKLRQSNQQLVKEHFQLKNRCYDLQQMNLKDKQKIKNLIIRINEVKNKHQTNSQVKKLFPSAAKLATDVGCISYSFLPQKGKIQTPYKVLEKGVCQNRECFQRKKYLQNQLYYERVQCGQLQLERRQWEKSKQCLKLQYNDLLDEIRLMRRVQI